MADGRVIAVQRTNLIQASKLSELLESALNKYNKHAIKMLKVIEELIELAKEMDTADKRGEAARLIKEEVVSYDALASHETAN